MMTNEFNTSELTCSVDGCNEVYVTKANFERIANKKQLKTSLESFNDLYESPLDFIFTTPELRGLYVYREILRNPRLLVEALDKNTNKKDTKTWVWEGNKPAYHCDYDCERLHSEFFNVEIPPEIKARGDLEIEKFRKFVKANYHLLKNDNEKLFRTRLEAQFFLKNPPKQLSKSNSGVECINNYDLKSLKDSIEKLLKESTSFMLRDEETTKIIRNKGYGTDRVKEAKVVGHPLYVWHQYKVELKSLLKSYYREQFNKEFKFEASLLEQMGFKPCSCCNEDKHFDL